MKKNKRQTVMTLSMTRTQVVKAILLSLINAKQKQQLLSVGIGAVWKIKLWKRYLPASNFLWKSASCTSVEEDFCFISKETPKQIRITVQHIHVCLKYCYTISFNWPICSSGPPFYSCDILQLKKFELPISCTSI